MLHVQTQEYYEAQPDEAGETPEPGTPGNGLAGTDDLPLVEMNGAGHKEPNTKLYAFEGPLFFGSAMKFRNVFSPQRDPKFIIIDFADTMVADFSAVTALRGVVKRYQQQGKHVKGLVFFFFGFLRRPFVPLSFFSPLGSARAERILATACRTQSQAAALRRG